MSASHNLNPNQFALPGMEHLSHPGAGLLARGMHFESGVPYGTERSLEVKHGYRTTVGQLIWEGKKRSSEYSAGEIQLVKVEHGYRRQGVATALYEAARRLPGQKPKHSAHRTDAGEAWARTTGARLPKRQRAEMDE